MQKRLCGREQEFGIEILPPFKPDPERQNIKQPYEGADFEKWRDEFVMKFLEEIGNQVPCYIAEASRHWWLVNGSVFYPDLHTIEIASAEYLVGSLDGLLQEKASELIALAAAKAVVDKLRLVSFSLYKNNVGPFDPRPQQTGQELIYGSHHNYSCSPQQIEREVTYGSHHNYSYSAGKASKIYSMLANFLPISLPLSGSGHVYRFILRDDAQYVLSQRAAHICRQSSIETTRERPLVNTKEESLMYDSAKLGRLHIISRDATRCEFQTWLIDTITHLVLRLVEEGGDLPPDLSDPLKELSKINFSFLSQNNLKVECRDGRQIDLIDYNRFFLNAAKQLNPLSGAEKQGLQEWERILELLEARAFDKLVGELDWATKWFLLKKKMAQHNFGLKSVQILKINMGYHNISASAKESWFARMDEDGYIKHLVSREDIEKARTTPPNTRAKSRAEFIKLCLCNQRFISQHVRREISWDKVYIMDDKGEELQLEVCFGEPDNPFTSYSSTLEQLYHKFNLQRPR